MRDRRPPLTQASLADRIGVTQSTVSDWLRRGRQPRAPVLNRLCASLGVRRQWLEHGEGEKFLPRLAVMENLAVPFSRRQKLTFIEDRFPEALPMLDSYLETLCREIPRSSLKRPTSRNKTNR